MLPCVSMHVCISVVVVLHESKVVYIICYSVVRSLNVKMNVELKKHANSTPVAHVHYLV